MSETCRKCPPTLVLLEGAKTVGLIFLVLFWIFLNWVSGRRV